MKKVILVLASSDYQPLEYSLTREVLEKSGVEVVIMSNKLGEAVSVQNYNTAEVDLILESGVGVNDFDGLFFIGGPGALEYLDNESSYSLLRNWQTTGKPYGAICISPRILAKAGVLQNKKATGWNGDRELANLFSQYGVEYIDEPVVRDDNVVTADGPGSVQLFGQTILKVL